MELSGLNCILVADFRIIGLSAPLLLEKLLFSNSLL